MNEYEELERSLELFLEPEGVEEESKQEAFVIDTVKKAEWATKKIKFADDKLAAIDEIFEQRMQELLEWKESASKEYLQTKARMEYLLRPYVAAAIEGCKKKYTDLPNGARVSLKASQPTYQYEEADLLKFLQESGNVTYIKTETKVKPMWSDFKKACELTEDGTLVTPDGEPVTCVTVIPKEDKFDCVFKEKK